MHLVVSVAPSKALMHDTIWLKTRWVHRWFHLFVPARWESSFLLFHNSYDFFCSVSDNSNSCSLDELISISGFRFMKNNNTKTNNKKHQHENHFSYIIFLLGTRGVSRTTWVIRGSVVVWSLGWLIGIHWLSISLRVAISFGSISIVCLGIYQCS